MSASLCFPVLLHTELKGYISGVSSYLLNSVSPGTVRTDGRWTVTLVCSCFAWCFLETSDRRLPNFLPATISSKIHPVCGSTCLKSPLHIPSVFFFALMKLILGWHQASSCWVCFVWQERDEKKQPVWKGQKDSALQKVPSSQAQVGRNLYALWWKRNLKVQPTKTTLWGRKIVQGWDVFLIFMPCIWRRSVWPLKNTHKPRGA